MVVQSHLNKWHRWCIWWQYKTLITAYLKFWVIFIWWFVFFIHLLIITCINTLMLTAKYSIGADGYCYCINFKRPSVPLSIHPDGCLSIPTMVLLLWLFKDFRYEPWIWRNDAQYHEADRYLKWPCSAIFCANSYWPEIWWPMVGWFTIPWSRSLLKWPCLANFCAFHGIFEIFHDRQDQIWWTTLTLWLFKRYQLSAWTLVGWCTVPWSRLLFEMGVHG